MKRFKPLLLCSYSQSCWIFLRSKSKSRIHHVRVIIDKNISIIQRFIHLLLISPLVIVWFFHQVQRSSWVCEQVVSEWHNKLYLWVRPWWQNAKGKPIFPSSKSCFKHNFVKRLCKWSITKKKEKKQTSELKSVMALQFILPKHTFCLQTSCHVIF